MSVLLFRKVLKQHCKHNDTVKKLDKTKQKQYNLPQIRLLCLEVIRRLSIRIGKVSKTSAVKSRKEYIMNVKQLRARNAQFARAISFVSLFLAVAFGLAACGGGGESHEQTILQTNPNVSGTTTGLNASFDNPALPLESGTPRVKALAATAVASESGTSTPYGGVEPLEAIRQLLDFAETSYPQYFTSKQDTQTWSQYIYRRYPGTSVSGSIIANRPDTYVGVAYNVTPGDGTCEGCVYVMGGDFGPSPVYVGRLTQFITPINILRYGEKAYSLWTANWPFAVTKTGVIRVINKTSSPGLLPYINCWLASKPLTDGKILANCLDNSGLNTGRHVLYINPIENALYDYTGNVPSDIVWLNLSSYDTKNPTEWLYSLKAFDGWIFVPQGAPWVLKFKDENTGNVSTIKEGTFTDDGSIKLLNRYSNP